MDDKIGKIKRNDFDLINPYLRSDQISRLNEIISDTSLHLTTDLGTCEISGVFILDDKTIYLTCGTSQIFISDKKYTYHILLTELGNNKLFSLVKEIKNK